MADVGIGRYKSFTTNHYTGGTMVFSSMLFVFLFMQLSDNMPYYLWFMTSFVAHISVLLCAAAPEGKTVKELCGQENREDQPSERMPHDTQNHL